MFNIKRMVYEIPVLYLVNDDTFEFVLNKQHFNQIKLFEQHNTSINKE